MFKRGESRSLSLAAIVPFIRAFAYFHPMFAILV
jgi:hypothetical protein